MFKEFREFAIKGNVVDLAVGVIIGAAFNGTVGSLVNDIIMPPLGAVAHKVDFANLYINFSETHFSSLAAARAAGAPVMAYGIFLNSVINFLIVAFVVFLLVKWINKLRRGKQTDIKPIGKKCQFCKMEDLPVDAVRCPHCTSQL